MTKPLAIVIRDDGFDKMLTPLTFALEHARRGGDVDVLFVLWAVRALTEAGARSQSIDGRHADQFEWLRRRLSQVGFPTNIREVLAATAATGRVRLFACKLAARTFGVNEADLIPEAEGILDPSAFLAEKAGAAEQCLCF